MSTSVSTQCQCQSPCQSPHSVNISLHTVPTSVSIRCQRQSPHGVNVSLHTVSMSVSLKSSTRKVMRIFSFWLVYFRVSLDVSFESFKTLSLFGVIQILRLPWGWGCIPNIFLQRNWNNHWILGKIIISMTPYFLSHFISPYNFSFKKENSIQIIFRLTFPLSRSFVNENLWRCPIYWRDSTTVPYVFRFAFTHPTFL